MPGSDVRIRTRVLDGTAGMQGRTVSEFGELFDTFGRHTEYGKGDYRTAATERFDPALEYRNELDKGSRPPD